MRNLSTLICVLLSLLCYQTPPSANAAKILGIFPFPGPSQYIFSVGLLKGLAERGHEVTSISAFPQKKPLKNFRDIAILANLGMTDDLMADMEEIQNKNSFEELLLLYDMSREICENVFNTSEVQQLLSSKTEKFDLILVEVFVIESLYGLAQHFNAPIIGVSTMGTTGWIDALVGNTSPASYLPYPVLPFTSKMSFWERLMNLSANMLEYVTYNLYHLPHQREIYAKYLPNAQISLDEVLNSFSLIFLNQHFSLGYPRPYVPNMIEVGGLHVKQQPDLLPADLQQFLDNATEGVIYFSLGSNLQGKDLPPEKRQIFLNTFRSLKQKVLWKFEDSEGMLADRSDNVRIGTWFPQQSVLAHHNVKLFISHGGWLSTTESVFHAKPILGIPMFGDQNMNVANAVQRGYALSVDFKQFNEADFKQKLQELLTNPRYTQAVANLSRQYRDQPMTPLETAVYWTEYVLRHDGAHHMRCAAMDLNRFEYHSLDTILTLCAGLLLVLAVALWCLCRLTSFICGGKDAKKVQNEKKIKKKKN